MLAVLKSEVLEVCNYTGFEDLIKYPSWMHSVIIDGTTTHPPLQESFDAMDDMFIFSPKSGIKRVDWDLFSRTFVLVDDTPILAGLLQDAVEVVCYNGLMYGDWESYPNWVQSMLADKDVIADADYDIAGAWQVCPGDVFLRNKEGTCRLMSQMDFEEYYFMSNGPLW